MLQCTVAGYLGADAEIKSENGKEFTTFRVAHSDRWTDANGQTKESTQWVDVILSGHPKVAEFLRKGTLVYCSGHCRLRCYSSEKARGFVAGITISATSIELLGGNSDAIPARLYSANGTMHNVIKYYHTDAAGEVLTNGRGKQFAVDDNGWVLPLEQAPADVQQQAQQAETTDQQTANSTSTKNGKKSK